jgi:hypothetical protein
MFSYLLNLFNNPPKHSSDSYPEGDVPFVPKRLRRGDVSEFDGVQHSRRSKR